MAETADRGGRTVLETLERGQVCKGVVSSIERFGAFVDIGGFHGLVNAAELAWLITSRQCRTSWRSDSRSPSWSWTSMSSGNGLPSR